MSDHNRRYKKIVRVDDATDDQIRAYAKEHGVTTSEACISLVGRAVGPAPTVTPWCAALPSDIADALNQRATAKGTTTDETIAAVLRVGLKRLDAIDKYAAKPKD